jgi:hypothetical protein
MKIFLKKILIFSFLPLVILLLFDFWLRGQDSIYEKKYEGLLSSKDLVQLLILGNSHATYGVDPTAFSNIYAYNLANLSQTLYFDKRLTLRSIQQGVHKLKYVLISIDYHSLFTESQEHRDYWSWYGHGIEYKKKNYLLPAISPFLWGYTPRVSFSLLSKTIRNHIRYAGKAIVHFNVEPDIDASAPLQQGFITFTETDEDSFNELSYRERIERYREPVGSKRAEVLTDLEDFIVQLQSSGITPIFFTSPTFHEYNQYLDSATIHRNMNDIHRLSEKYSIDHWDYMDDRRFTKENFYNSDHLNKKGAGKFSKILSERLNILQLQRRDLLSKEGYVRNVRFLAR